MYNMIQYLVPILLVSAFAIAVLGPKRKKAPLGISFASLALSLLITIYSAFEISKSGIIKYQLSGWRPPFGITVAVDGIGLLMLSIIFTVGIISLIIAKEEIKERETEFFTLFMIFTLGLTGMTITGDIFNFFVFLEISSISSYILASFSREKSSFEAAIKYIVIGSFATSLVLLGVSFLYGIYGTLNMADLALQVEKGFGSYAALALILSGLFVKAAVVPFHAWKPDLIRSAPISFGLAFAASSTSVALYAVFRILYTIYGAFSTAKVLIYISLITMALGAVMAMQEKDLKKMIAYSAISQIGYILMGFALGFFDRAGFTAGLYHMINLVIIDAALFASAFIIISHFRTSDMSRMGGISNSNRLLMAVFATGLLSLVGIPFVNGFASKWMLYIISFQVYPIAAFVSLIVSAATLAYCFKAFELIFLNNTGTEKSGAQAEIHIPGHYRMLLYALLFIMIAIGVLPDIGLYMSERIMNLSLDRILYISGVMS